METARLIFILTVSAFLYTSCSKAPDAPAPAAQNKPMEAKPFKGEVYRAINDSQVITLISNDELEWRKDGTTLVCKYSKQEDKLRVIAQLLGTTQAIYYRHTDQGLQSDDGTILYNRERYAATKQAILAQERQQAESRQTKPVGSDNATAYLQAIHKNLRTIDHAKDLWALANNKGAGESNPGLAELLSTAQKQSDAFDPGSRKDFTVSAVVGETYTPNPVGTRPTAKAPIALGRYPAGATIE